MQGNIQGQQASPSSSPENKRTVHAEQSRGPEGTGKGRLGGNTGDRHEPPSWSHFRARQGNRIIDLGRRPRTTEVQEKCPRLGRAKGRYWNPKGPCEEGKNPGSGGRGPLMDPLSTKAAPSGGGWRGGPSVQAGPPILLQEKEAVSSEPRHPQWKRSSREPVGKTA